MWLKYYTQRTEHKVLFRSIYKANCQEVGEKNRFIECSGKTDSTVLASKEKIINKIRYQLKYLIESIKCAKFHRGGMLLLKSHVKQTDTESKLN